MAAGDLKIDIINGAYSDMRISGLTVQPSPENNDLALDKLEGLAAELFEDGVCIDYNSEDEPDVNTKSGVKRAFKNPLEWLLAQRLLSNFGKGQTPDPILLMSANAAVSFLYGRTATPRMTQYPRRQPIGNGNSRRWGRWSRYFRPIALAPNTCETNKMVVGDINDYVEHFDSYLKDGEDLSSYVLTADEGLTILAQALDTPDVNYQVKAVGSNGTKSDALLQVKIVATTSDDRVETRLIDFELININETP